LIEKALVLAVELIRAFVSNSMFQRNVPPRALQIAALRTSLDAKRVFSTLKRRKCIR